MNTFLKYVAHVLASHEAAFHYMDQAQYTSNLESEAELRTKLLTKRAKKPKRVILPGEEEDTSDEEIPKKIKKIHNFPIPPKPDKKTIRGRNQNGLSG